MYQFPDSSEVMSQEPVPLNKGTRYKVILIANLLLALFIIAIIWFFFFFDSKPHHTVTLSQSLITKSLYQDTQHLTGDYTPIITSDADPAPTAIIPPSENNISIIAEMTQNDTDNKKRITPPTLSNIETNKEKQLRLKSDNTLALITIEDTNPQPLSAIQLITNELMKNKDRKSDQNHINNKTILANSSVPKKEIAQVKQEKQKRIEKNQVIIKQPIEQPLARKIAKISQELDNSNQQLTKESVDPDKPALIENTAHKSRNTAIYNSISLKKESDIDKIMLAMGSIKKPAEEKAADKIDTIVKKLLKNEASNVKNTDLYVRKLQPESEENKKEVRTIMVKQGEKLWDIAVRAYGDGNKYKILLEANPVLKNNPKLIKAGITLRAPL